MGSISTGIIKDINSPYNMNIYLEKMNYFPGETIQGLIQLTSNKIIDKKKISSLKINFVLKNIEYWQNRQNFNDSNQETPTPDDNGPKEGEHPDDKKHYFERIIFTNEDLIFNLIDSFNNNINIFNRKEINIPINIQIPNDIQPSLEWNKDNNIYCYSRNILSINIPELKIFSNFFLFIHKNVLFHFYLK